MISGMLVFCHVLWRQKLKNKDISIRALTNEQQSLLIHYEWTFLPCDS